MNITLIGMPGSGKSFVGNRLADRLGHTCIELDRVMEREYNVSLQRVVEELGEQAFLAKEEETAISCTDGKDDHIVSPGGSIIYSKNAMKHLKKISTIVYLRTPIEMLEERIGGIPRGIIGAKDKTFAELYAERVLLYEKWADHTIDGGQKADAVVSDILRIVHAKPSLRRKKIRQVNTVKKLAKKTAAKRKATSKKK